MLVSSDDFVAHTDRSSAGTKMPRTNWKDMSAFETIVPPSPVALAFQDQVGPMLDMIAASIHESRRLATLRDYPGAAVERAGTGEREADKLMRVL